MSAGVGVTNEEIREAVARAYAGANDVPLRTVRAGFDDPEALDFDSLCGLELMVALEDRFGVEIPATEGTRPANFHSLRSFAEMVGRYLSEATARAGSSERSSEATAAARREHR